MTLEFVSIRDMRTRPGEIWQQLQEEGNLVLTSNGRPFALMISTEDEDVEELLLAVRRARAQVALSRLRRQAERDGVSALSMEEIETEIVSVRRERPT